MASLLRFSVLATTTLVMACGSSVETGTGGAATTTTTTTTGAGGTGTTTSTSTSSTSSTGSTSTGTTGTGGPCGSFGGATCGSDEYCDYSDNRCGSVEGNGTCKKRPTACPELDDPACGCDGKVYGTRAARTGRAST